MNQKQYREQISRLIKWSGLELIDKKVELMQCAYYVDNKQVRK